MIGDYFILAWREVHRRKKRSFLTLLGIIIGIAAVVSLITLGQGLENAIMKQFSALGNDKLIITAKGSALTPGLSIDAVKITQDDLKVIGSLAEVKKTAGMIYSSARIEFNDHVRYFMVMGMPTDPEERALIGETQNFHLLKGRSLDKGDLNKAVLGFEYTQKGLFEREIELGDILLVQNEEFKVIGFWDRTGSPPDDQAVTIPLEAYETILGEKDELGLIIAQTQPGEDPAVAAKSIEKELRKSRGVEEGNEDFSVETPQQMAETFSTILDIVGLVVIGIAAISLVVGSVGIMNTMYTAVLQRTKEIGLLKAVGARNKHILLLFMVESGFYGLGGGIIGVVLGITFAKVVEYVFVLVVGPAFLEVEIAWWFVIVTVLFSFFLGCVSGLAPALKAAKLNPVESLRYE